MRTASLALCSLLVACSSANSSSPPAEPLTAPPVVVQPPAPPPATPPSPAAPASAQVRITMTEQVMAEMPEIPRHEIRVLVTRAGHEETVDVGALNGCAMAEEVTSGSLATVRCWWAGAGETIEVLTREDAVIVTRQDEESEVAEDFPVRELGRIALGGASAELVH